MKIEIGTVVEEGSKWLAKHSVGRSDAYIWTVRGNTECGIYVTTPEGRTPGHLISHEEFSGLYVPVVS